MKSRVKTSEWGKGHPVAGLVVLLALIGIVSSGCSLIESIDRKLIEWGVVDSLDGADIDTLAVVEVVAGNTRGVGVILDGGMVFTANHVVKGGETVLVKTFGLYRDATFQTLEARVVYRDKVDDQALLSIVDTEVLEHSVELGKARPGPASVIPLRPGGRSALGSVVYRPVVRRVEVCRERNRIRSLARLARGDSGAPVIQDGKVVGLVRGATRMVSSDVMANYRFLLKTRKTRSAKTRESTGTSEEPSIPECRKNQEEEPIS